MNLLLGHQTETAKALGQQSTRMDSMTTSMQQLQTKVMSLESQVFQSGSSVNRLDNRLKKDKKYYIYMRKWLAQLPLTQEGHTVNVDLDLQGFIQLMINNYPDKRWVDLITD
jgi:uncharacterized protein YlxW (UPF0749 family)